MSYNKKHVKQLLIGGLLSISFMGHCGTMMDNATLNLWEGFYLGGYLGGAKSDAQLDMDAGSVAISGLPSYFTNQADINAIHQSGTGSLNPNTFIGGIQGGSNIMVKHFIFGAVVDLGSFHIDKALNVGNAVFPSNPSITYNFTNSVTTEWLFTARANAGIIIHNWIQPYITGGLAVTDLQVHYKYQDTINSTSIFESKNGENKAGWTAGAGIQMPINDYLLVNAEYLYVDFKPRESYGVVTCADLTCSSPLRSSVDFSTNLFKLSMSYRFP